MTTSAVSVLVNGHYRTDYTPSYGVEIAVAHSGRWARSLVVEQRASTGIKNGVAINASFVPLLKASGLTFKAATEAAPRVQFEKVS